MYDALTLQRMLRRPILMIYTDGQVIVRDGDWYGTAMLEPTDLCAILRLELQAGIENQQVTYATPIPDIGFGNGEGSYTLELSTPKGTLRRSFSAIERDYVTPAFRAPFDRLDDYLANLDLKPYWAAHFVFWAERLGKAPAFNGEDPNTYFWPDWLGQHSLATKLGNRPSGLIEPDEDFLNSYLRWDLGSRPNVGVFQSDGDYYGVVIRPLLPHESRIDFEPDVYATHGGASLEPVPFDQLPFACP